MRHMKYRSQRKAVSDILSISRRLSIALSIYFSCNSPNAACNSFILALIPGATTVTSSCVTEILQVIDSLLRFSVRTNYGSTLKCIEYFCRVETQCRQDLRALKDSRL